jgi:hypothetical protein
MLDYKTIITAREAWVDNRDKMISEEELFWVDISDLYKLRKKRRTRRNSKSGSVDLDYISMGKTRRKFRRNHPDKILDGKEKWDQLTVSMKDHGWLESHPALIMVSNRRSTPKIRDGHHRLGVAMELGITKCPVKFYYVWKEL